MKKVICAALALLLVFSLAGCSGEKPEEVVERVTQAIKEGKIESVRGNIDLSALDKLFPASEEESKKATDETLLSEGQEILSG